MFPCFMRRRPRTVAPLWPEAAFSLIEVALALAVTSTGVLLYLVVNAASLQTLTAARQTEAAARICRAVLNEARAADFAALPALAGEATYDGEGNPSVDDAVYRAEVRTFAPAGLAAGTSLGLVVEVSPAARHGEAILQRALIVSNRSKPTP